MKCALRKVKEWQKNTKKKTADFTVKTDCVRRLGFAVMR